MLHVRALLRHLLRAQILGGELGHDVRLEAGEVPGRERAHDLGLALLLGEIRTRQLTVSERSCTADAGERTRDGREEVEERPVGL